MTTNPHHDRTEHNRLLRFTDGVLTLQHQIKRADDFAQDGQWLMALEFLDVSTRTLNILKRVARAVPHQGAQP